jgi:hypothetical protein
VGSVEESPIKIAQDAVRISVAASLSGDRISVKAIAVRRADN